MRARGFWGRGQNSYFDVVVTNAGAASHAKKPLKSVLAKYERAKKSKYNHRVMNIEQGTFTPLIFTANGCMGPECSMFHKSIADKISEKTGEAYADVMNFIWCKLSFILLRSAIMCVRESRRPQKSDNLITIRNDFGLYAKDFNTLQLYILHCLASTMPAAGDKNGTMQTMRCLDSAHNTYNSINDEI